jgi:hypothetical protein
MTKTFKPVAPLLVFSGMLLDGGAMGWRKQTGEWLTAVKRQYEK